MNWENLILAALAAAADIRRRHAAANPSSPPLEDADVARLVVSEMRSAQSHIAAAFAEFGLPLPE